MPKDYYLILGLSRDADSHDIKRAYRDLAKRIHPDVDDSQENREKFLEVKEAYETLADDAKRRHYDDQLAGREQGRPGGREKAEYPASGTVWSSRFSARSPTDFFQELLTGFPGFQRFEENEADLFFEAVLTPSEAETGGEYSINLPLRIPCPRCTGSGFLADPFCPACAGRSTVLAERELSLHIPPHVRDGTHLRLSLETSGSAQSHVTIVVRIDPFSGP